MKKIVSLLLVLALCLLSITACSGDKAQGDIDVAAAAQQAKDAGGYTDELIQLTDETILSSYALLDTQKLESYAVYVSGTMGTPEEVAVLTGKSDEDVAGILAAVQRRVEDLTINFEDYRPDEMPKIQNAVIVEKGRTVLFAICPEHDAVQKVFDKL